MTTTGPYQRSINVPDTRLYQQWYRSKPPYATSNRPPLPYQKFYCRCRGRSGPVGGVWLAANTTICNWLSGPSSGSASALNRARKKFLSKLGETALLTVDYAERKQSFDMIANSAKRLAGAARLLNAGRALAAARQLGVRYRGHPFVAAKEASNLWLEWHFGWSPLIADIYAAIDILQRSWYPAVCKGGGSTTFDTTTGFNTPGFWFSVISFETRCLVQAEVSAENPMLARANQLGLLNPATVAWETVPFSFLIDWFVPVGDFLSQYTDLAGFKIENGFYTIYYSSAQQVSTYVDPVDGSQSIAQFDGYGMFRYLGTPDVSLRFTKPKELSPERAYTALSLAVQQLAKLGRKTPGLLPIQ